MIIINKHFVRLQCATCQVDFTKGALVRMVQNECLAVSVFSEVDDEVHMHVCVQRSVLDAVMDVTRERPWLWVIIIIVVIAPLFMCVIYCCVPPSQVLAVTVTVLTAHSIIH